ncbi:hypothetical protein [Streptomyces sp. MJM1172]|uniref:hypothetical protein n=1 Tax=Streptomyces sp. MJM1172 TaxID=1703926 RepID=UPI0011610701|nr:hypothetical protein [Streptomyces sp. MJM1172]
MGRPMRWGVVVLATAVVFGACFALVRVDPFGWLPRNNSDAVAVAAALAGAVAAAALAAGSWWAGGPGRSRRSVRISGVADRGGRLYQTGWGEGEEDVDLTGRADRRGHLDQDRAGRSGTARRGRDGSGGA